MFSLINRGKRKADDDDDKENTRPNKLNKIDSNVEVVEIEQKSTKQRKRHASEDKYEQDFKMTYSHRGRILLFCVPKIRHKSKKQNRNLDRKALNPC